MSKCAVEVAGMVLSGMVGLWDGEVCGLRKEFVSRCVECGIWYAGMRSRAGGVELGRARERRRGGGCGQLARRRRRSEVPIGGWGGGCEVGIWTCTIAQ